MGPDANDFDDDGGEFFSAVSFFWAPEDAKAAARYFVPPVLEPHIKGEFGVFTVIGLGLFGVLGLSAPELVGQITLLFYSSMAVIVVFGACAILWRRRIRHRSAMADPRKIGSAVVRIDHYGIVLATDVSHEFISWFGVKKVEADGRGLFFRSGPHHGIYVPRAAFPAEARFREFCARVQSFQASKKPPTHLRLIGPSPGDGSASIN